jgi:hypothetical protein
MNDFLPKYLDEAREIGAQLLLAGTVVLLAGA